MEIVGASSDMKQTVKKCDQVPPDINMIVESVRADLEIQPAFSRSCCIYKVPDRLLQLNKNAYTPRVVSIGPIHHGNEKLRAILEEHKRMYLQKFLQLSKVSLKNFVEVVMSYEIRLRNCYAETIEFSSKDFVKMILMDTAFVIMILLKNAGLFRDEVDRIFDRPMKKALEQVEGKFERKLFNTPWAAISGFGAIILLILSVIQSVCSIIQVRQK